MKLMQRIIMVLLPLLLLFPTSLAYADMAPPPAPLLTGLEPFEYQDTHVQMVYERVELEVQDDQDSANGYSGSQVLVKASFVMRNRGKASESMQSIFPLESLSYCITNYAAGNSPSYTYYGIDEDSFEIQVNGSTVPTRVVTTPHPYHDTSPDTCTEMHWIGFDVSFPVDTDVVVTVSYSMQSQTADAMQNIDYVLETGAGWYGPIERAYVVAKFPYTVSKDNILKDTTPGYQTLYNEIFWAFQNFEPGGKDNIRISIVSPGIWESILSVRQKIEEDPAVPQNWLDLAQAFQEIAYWHGSNIRSTYYLEQVPGVYENGIRNNPNNAQLYAEYAMLKLGMARPGRKPNPAPNDLKQAVLLVDQALALDPANATARYAQSYFQSLSPNASLTPPPTIAPTPTPVVSQTPSPTPIPSVTPTSSPTVQIVERLVVITQVVVATAVKPSATPTPEPAPSISWEGSGSSLFLGLLLLIGGFTGGLLVSRRK